MAILRRARRSATVRAVTRTNLLLLDAADFHDLMEQEPRISERVHTVVRDRLGREMISPRGDMVTEELTTPGES
jgi:voltage-gated potassium channel